MSRQMTTSTPPTPPMPPTAGWSMTSDSRRFHVEYLEKEHYAVFRHTGFYSVKEKQAINEMNARVLATEFATIVIDMTDTFLVDEFGVGNMLVLNGCAQAKGKTILVLINGDNNPRRRLQATGLGQVIPVCTSLAQLSSRLAAD